jgi:hypothetical protein
VSGEKCGLDVKVYRLSKVFLSTAIKLSMWCKRERTRLPYAFSTAEADGLVVMWVWMFFEI